MTSAEQLVRHAAIETALGNLLDTIVDYDLVGELDAGAEDDGPVRTAQRLLGREVAA